MREHAIETCSADPAALLGMVARYSDGDTVAEIRDAADFLRSQALDLSEEDIGAFSAARRHGGRDTCGDPEPVAARRARRLGVARALR